MRIRTKLLIGFFIILILMMTVVIIIAYQQAKMKHSFLMIKQINTVEKLFLECRRQEKNYLLRCDTLSANLFQRNFQNFEIEIANLRNSCKNTRSIFLVDSLKGKTIQYDQLFERLIINYPKHYHSQSGSPEIDKNISELVLVARLCHSLIIKIKNKGQITFKTASTTANMVSIAAIFLGFITTTLAVIILTRNIVKPIEKLRLLADKVYSADIQDMDVEFRDLDMSFFNNKETYDLATALKRMVTNLRYLVPSERGLMDEYHMTVVVLANKALGPAGWAVVERARAAAGFNSFAEISPLNIKKFSKKLYEEAIKVFPKQNIKLLIETIERLNNI